MNGVAAPLSGMTWPLTVAAGAVLGLAVGMIGTSGVIMIPTLVFLFGLPQLKAQGTAFFIAATPLWIAPLIPYARTHNVDWRLGTLLAVGMAVGGYFGAVWAQEVSVTVVRRCFAVLLAVASVRMFLQR